MGIENMERVPLKVKMDSTIVQHPDGTADLTVCFQNFPTAGLAAAMYEVMCHIMDVNKPALIDNGLPPDAQTWKPETPIKGGPPDFGMRLNGN